MKVYGIFMRWDTREEPRMLATTKVFKNMVDAIKLKDSMARRPEFSLYFLSVEEMNYQG